MDGLRRLKGHSTRIIRKDHGEEPIRAWLGNPFMHVNNLITRHLDYCKESYVLDFTFIIINGALYH